MEDRGKSAWIWSDGQSVVFDPFPNCGERVEISVPIGWFLKSREDGTVIENVYGRAILAAEVLAKAFQGIDGFQIRSWSSRGKSIKPFLERLYGKAC